MSLKLAQCEQGETSREVLPLARWLLGDTQVMKVKGTFLQQLYFGNPSTFSLLPQAFLDCWSNACSHCFCLQHKDWPCWASRGKLSSIIAFCISFPASSSLPVLWPQEASSLEAPRTSQGHFLGHPQRPHSEPQNIWMSGSEQASSWRRLYLLHKKPSCGFLCLSWQAVLRALLSSALFQALLSAHCLKSASQCSWSGGAEFRKLQETGCTPPSKEIGSKIQLLEHVLSPLATYGISIK